MGVGRLAYTVGLILYTVDVAGFGWYVLMSLDMAVVVDLCFLAWVIFNVDFVCLLL